MNKNDRHADILSILHRTPFATVEYLAEVIHISPSSIRRDLTLMEAQGLVRRTHGGVSLMVSENLSIPFALRMKNNVHEKKEIARKALELVYEGDVIFLDASSTTMYLAMELVKKRGITIITNSIEAAHYLTDFNVKTICTGGNLNPEDRNALVGDAALRTISSIRANVAFFTPQAIDNAGDLSDCYQEETAIVRAMMHNAAQKVALCDSSKIGKRSTYKQCCIIDLDALIGEINLSPFYSETFPSVKYY